MAFKGPGEELDKVQSAILRCKAACASERRDWDSRIEARVWRGVGSEGERRRASVIRASQADSAWGEKLE